MRKAALLLSIFGGSLAVFGLSSGQPVVQPKLRMPGESGLDRAYRAGWTLGNQLEITFGVALLVCGLILRRDAR